MLQVNGCDVSRQMHSASLDTLCTSAKPIVVEVLRCNSNNNNNGCCGDNDDRKLSSDGGSSIGYNTDSNQRPRRRGDIVGPSFGRSRGESASRTLVSSSDKMKTKCTMMMTTVGTQTDEDLDCEDLYTSCSSLRDMYMYNVHQ